MGGAGGGVVFKKKIFQTDFEQPNNLFLHRVESPIWKNKEKSATVVGLETKSGPKPSDRALPSLLPYTHKPPRAVPDFIL